MNSQFVLGVGVGIIAITCASIYLIYLNKTQKREIQESIKLKQANKSVINYIKTSGENIFEDLGFHKDEARDLLVKAHLIINKKNHIIQRR